jgi:large subunit ribosomal protein L3
MASAVRTGLIAVKKGMTALWDSWGVRQPLTVLQVENCQVLQVKTLDKDGYSAVQLGAGTRHVKNVPNAMRGHFSKAGVGPKRYIAEFHVDPSAAPSVGLAPPPLYLTGAGTEITSRHFVPGQFVDVAGTTIGKGFQGGMKRHGFAGLPASHGTSVSHRSIGSTGNRKTPARVFKNKKMPGHMGCDRVTVQNVEVGALPPPLMR